VVHVIDDPGGILGHLDGAVLVDQEITTLDGVERVLLPVVISAVGMVAKRSVDAALSLPRVAAARVHLREDGHIDPGLLGLYRSAEAG
jgi:hypothetical protein